MQWQGRVLVRLTRVRGVGGLDEDEVGDDSLEGGEDGAKQGEEEPESGEVVVAVCAV